MYTLWNNIKILTKGEVEQKETALQTLIENVDGNLRNDMQQLNTQIRADMTAGDDRLSAEIDSLSEQLSEMVHGEVATQLDGDLVPVGETMYWPKCDCVTRTVHSDSPFEFEVNGKQYSVEVPDEEVELMISKELPSEKWHALDGSIDLLAADYPTLASFMPDNVTTDGHIWLPYCRQKIIKIA